MKPHHAFACISMVAFSAAVAVQPRTVWAAAPCGRVAQGGPVSDPQGKAKVKDIVVRYLRATHADLAKSAAETDVHVLRSFHQGAWTVYGVSAPAIGLEPGLLFVNDRMASHQQPYVWSGAATPDERADIIQDIESNNKGIGNDLVACVVDAIVGRGP